MYNIKYEIFIQAVYVHSMYNLFLSYALKLRD